MVTTTAIGPRPRRVEPTPEPLIDASLRRGMTAMALVGGVLGAVGAGVWGVKTGVSIAIGTLVAIANLLVLARVIRALLVDRSGGWLFVGFAKMGALFAGVGWLFHANVVGALPFVVGYASLPLGLVLAQTPLPPDDAL